MAILAAIRRASSRVSKFAAALENLLLLALGGTNVAPRIGGRLLVRYLVDGRFIGFVGSLLSVGLFLRRGGAFGLNGVMLKGDWASEFDWAPAPPVIKRTIAPAQTSLRSIAYSKPFDRPRSAWQNTAVQSLRNSVGNFAMFTAMRRASSLVMRLAADRRPGSFS